jgi:SAM-dependent methyltransferase
VARPYLERFQLIKELFDVRDCTVLDLGCGPGVLEPYLLDRGCRVVAADLSEKMIEKARETVASRLDSANARFCIANAESLPFDDASFDAVACIGVISYLSDPVRGLSEIARVVRPGGVVLTQASNPIAPKELGERFVRRPYNWLRTVVTGRDYRDSDFPLATYFPRRLESLMTRVGLRPDARRSYDFEMPFLNRIAPRTSDRIRTSLMRFSRSPWLGLIGAGYIVRAVRETAPGDSNRSGT